MSWDSRCDEFRELATEYYNVAKNNLDRFNDKLPSYLNKDDLEDIFYIILGSEPTVQYNETDDARDDGLLYCIKMNNRYLTLEIEFTIENGDYYVTQDEVKLTTNELWEVE